MVRDDIQEAASFIRSRIGASPAVALVLGSGLGSLADDIEGAVALPYGDIPHFPVSTAPGHAGRLVAGSLAGVPVLAMQGRFHFYEGHPMASIAFPVRTFKALGVRTLFLTNAAGGVNESFSPGDFMALRDHINLSGQNPLIGPNDDSLGPRSPDMSTTYTPRLLEAARKAASDCGVALREGVYAWFTGPSFETPAEIRMARTLGADAVGMSTAPEAIVARHCGMDVLGISCITNMAAGILDQPITGEEVMEIADKRRPEFVALVKRILGLI
ncbi:MAG: purine-nucleoside phosphorylase [Spirochaetes bacterium]|nr:purine-nucleoside phosphorylase [Spirochaetota bacterium]